MKTAAKVAKNEYFDLLRNFTIDMLTKVIACFSLISKKGHRWFIAEPMDVLSHGLSKLGLCLRLISKKSHRLRIAALMDILPRVQVILATILLWENLMSIGEIFRLGKSPPTIWQHYTNINSGPPKNLWARYQRYSLDPLVNALVYLEESGRQGMKTNIYKRVFCRKL